MLKLKIPNHTIQVKFADGFDLSQFLAWLLPADRVSPTLAAIEADFERKLAATDMAIDVGLCGILNTGRMYRVVKRGPGIGGAVHTRVSAPVPYGVARQVIDRAMLHNYLSDEVWCRVWMVEVPR